MVNGPAAFAAPESTVPLGPSCPSLYAFGVQGADESSPNVPSTSDTGALGQLFGPLSAKSEGRVQRSYIAFGYDNDGTALPYDEAVATAAERLESAATDVLKRCPATKLAVAGYAQGAPAVSRFAEQVGRGAHMITPDRVAGIALLANPARSANAPVLPGRPQASTPAAAPGTSGEKVATISLRNPPLSGAGIATAPVPDYGSLSGRVADLCVPGDATCDAPAGSPLVATVANIAAQSELRDPIAAISTVAEALSTTAFTTAVDVVNEDLHGTSLDQLSYEPAKPLGQRLAEASAPSTTPPGPNEALSALFKLGTLGLSAVVSVAQKVITPATVAELAVVGMANPWAAVATIGAKIATAVTELIPPQTASRWINQAFEAITSTVIDQRELYTLAGAAQYSSTTGRHGSYQTVPATTSGRAPLAAVADWFAGLAHDLGPADSAPVRPEPTTRTTTAQTTTGGGR
ncbi:cutinase family protein [Nocardia brasiliensis]|uniref:cutinase family protein n=1 Tax=Nocardia brasiliensis TaxID=37326 RepID=UPI002B4ABB96|nr:cutinase family protein [Nocardia brasiliensis]